MHGKRHSSCSTIPQGAKNRDHVHKYPHQLSQGERQRVAIGRALITDPKIVLADEPTGNLDPDNKQRVLQVMLDEVAQRGLTLVMVTHDYQLLDAFDRSIAVEDLLSHRSKSELESDA